MTAAVARPPLFTHLVATRPPREKGSFSATATSILIHAALIASVLLLSARVRTPERPVIEEGRDVVLPPLISTQDDPAGQPGVGARRDVVVPKIPMPQFDDLIPKNIPAPGRLSFDEPPDFARLPRPGTGTSNQAAGAAGATGEAPAGELFVPFTVKPELLNRAEVARLLQRYYPPLLMQAGMGGQVVVWLQIDLTGEVLQARVSQASQHKEFDEAALRVAKAMRFSTAYNRDQKVKVWVELPIIFGTK